MSDPNRSAPNKDPEVSLGFKKAFRKLFLNPDIGVQIRSEFSHFVGYEGLGVDIEAMRDKTLLTPMDWWNFPWWGNPKYTKIGNQDVVTGC